MSTPLISILHPTARTRPYPPSLPLGWKHTCDAFFRAAKDPKSIEYVISVHESRWEEFWYGTLSGTRLDGELTFVGEAGVAIYAPDYGLVRVVKNCGRDTNIDNLNNAARASTGRILVGTMDDLFPPQGWDRLIISALSCHNLREPLLDDLEAVLHCSTGSLRDRELINAGAITRKRYERYGYIGHPSYESMFADNELSEVARFDGVVIERLDIQFEHRHYTFGKSAEDAVYRDQNAEAKYRQGAANFKARQRAGFPVAWESASSDGKTVRTVAEDGTVTDGPVVGNMQTFAFFGKALEMPQPPQPHYLVGDELAMALGKPRRIRPPEVGPPILACCLAGETFSSAWVSHWTALVAYFFGNYTVLPKFGIATDPGVMRQGFTEELLRDPTRPDYVLWLDDDQLLHYEQFRILMRHLVQKNLDIVAGWTLIQASIDNSERPMPSCGYFSDSTMTNKVSLTEDQLNVAAKAGKLIDVEWSGFPCVLMRMDVLEKLGPLSFLPILDERFRWGKSGEDIAFFRRAREAGYHVWIDPAVKIPHLKLGDVGDLWKIHKKASEDTAPVKELATQC